MVSEPAAGGVAPADEPSPPIVAHPALLAGSIARFVIAFRLDHAERPASASLRIGRAG
jgi:hypothetical protein